MLLCFFFNDTATTEIYTLSLHDALPIYQVRLLNAQAQALQIGERAHGTHAVVDRAGAGIVVGEPDEPVRREGRQHVRSEEHTSELQSRQYLVCRLLLEKKKKNISLYWSL